MPLTFANRLRIFTIAWLLSVSQLAILSVENSNKALDEDAVCRRQLHIIYEACQRYMRDFGVLPVELNQLTPTYLSDSSLLVCPTIWSSSAPDEDSRFLNQFDVDRKTSYFSEFNNKLVSELIRGDTPIRNREWKELLRRTPVGDKVPIVRCNSSHILNLAYDGSIYESGVYWESLFVDEITMPYLLCELARKGLLSERIEPRTIQDPRCLDLADAGNGLLQDPWWIGFGDYGLSTLKASLESSEGVIGGVLFDARCLIQVRGKLLEVDDPELSLIDKGYSSPGFPTTSKWISVGQTGRRLWVLGGSLFPGERGVELARIELVREAGGSVDSLPIIYGEHVEEMWYRPDASAEDSPAPVPIWTGANPEAEVQGERLRVYLNAYDIPSPEERIEKIRLVSSALSVSSPFVVGMTLE